MLFFIYHTDTFYKIVKKNVEYITVPIVGLRCTFWKPFVFWKSGQVTLPIQDLNCWLHFSFKKKEKDVNSSPRNNRLKNKKTDGVKRTKSSATRIPPRLVKRLSPAKLNIFCIKSIRYNKKKKRKICNFFCKVKGEVTNLRAIIPLFILTFPLIIARKTKFMT